MNIAMCAIILALIAPGAAGAESYMEASAQRDVGNADVYSEHHAERIVGLSAINYIGLSGVLAQVRTDWKQTLSDTQARQIEFNLEAVLCGNELTAWKNEMESEPVRNGRWYVDMEHDAYRIFDQDTWIDVKEYGADKIRAEVSILHIYQNPEGYGDADFIRRHNIVNLSEDQYAEMLRRHPARGVPGRRIVIYRREIMTFELHPYGSDYEWKVAEWSKRIASSEVQEIVADDDMLLGVWDGTIQNQAEDLPCQFVISRDVSGAIVGRMTISKEGRRIAEYLMEEFRTGEYGTPTFAKVRCLKDGSDLGYGPICNVRMLGPTAYVEPMIANVGMLIYACFLENTCPTDPAYMTHFCLAINLKKSAVGSSSRDTGQLTSDVLTSAAEDASYFGNNGVNLLLREQMPQYPNARVLEVADMDKIKSRISRTETGYAWVRRQAEELPARFLLQGDFNGNDRPEIAISGLLNPEHEGGAYRSFIAVYERQTGGDYRKVYYWDGEYSSIQSLVNNDGLMIVWALNSGYFSELRWNGEEYVSDDGNSI